jgi:hypothetical protein
MVVGLPGLGIGTLFYVLTALWMPMCELRRVCRGDVSAARWRLVMVQLCFALSVVASVALADRAIGIVLGGRGGNPLEPGWIVNERLAAQAPQSIWAAPAGASLVVLVTVLLLTELLRVFAVKSRALAERRATRQC